MKTKLNGILTLLLALVVQVAFAQQTVTGTGNRSERRSRIRSNGIRWKEHKRFTTTDFDGKYTIEAISRKHLSLFVYWI